MISPELAAFLHDGVGIHIGTRNERMEPSGARVNAVRVDDDGVHLVAYLSKVAAERVLANLKANGQVALSFGRPIDERACQVKGVYVSSRATRVQERPIVIKQWDAFLRNLEYIGIPRAGGERAVLWPSLAIRVKATAFFEQTPGPQAGTAMSPEASPQGGAR